MIENLKSLVSDYLNYLRDLSYRESPERLEFAKKRTQGHRDYMSGHSRFDPYLHEEEWSKHNM